MTAKASKPVTAAKVRAVLRKAGFPAAKSAPTRIRGLRDWSEGFKVETRSDGSIRAFWQPASFVRGNTEREQQRLSSYQAALVAAGIACEIDLDVIVIETTKEVP